MLSVANITRDSKGNPQDIPIIPDAAPVILVTQRGSWSVGSVGASPQWLGVDRDGDFGVGRNVGSLEDFRGGRVIGASRKMQAGTVLRFLHREHREPGGEVSHLTLAFRHGSLQKHQQSLDGVCCGELDAVKGGSHSPLLETGNIALMRYDNTEEVLETYQAGRKPLRRFPMRDTCGVELDAGDGASLMLLRLTSTRIIGGSGVGTRAGAMFGV